VPEAIVFPRAHSEGEEFPPERGEVLGLTPAVADGFPGRGYASLFGGQFAFTIAFDPAPRILQIGIEPPLDGLCSDHRDKHV
jgi:hypothetical protein